MNDPSLGRLRAWALPAVLALLLPAGLAAAEVEFAPEAVSVQVPAAVGAGLTSPVLSIPADVFARDVSLQTQGLAGVAAPGAQAAAAAPVAARLQTAFQAQAQELTGAARSQAVATQSVVVEALSKPAVLAQALAHLDASPAPEAAAARRNLAGLAAEARSQGAGAGLGRYAATLNDALAASLSGDDQKFAAVFDGAARAQALQTPAPAPAVDARGGSSLFSRLMPASWRLQKAASPSALLKSAGFSDNRYGRTSELEQELGAAFGLWFNGTLDKPHAYALSGGVPNFGRGDYYPRQAGYLVSPGTLEIAQDVLSKGTTKGYEWASPILDAFLSYAANEPGRRDQLLARLAELQARPRQTVDGREYVAIGSFGRDGEVPMRPAQASDWGPAPKTRINGLTSQEVLELPGEKRQFGNVLSKPLEYSGNGTISYRRTLPVVENREVYLVSDRGAIHGTFRGYWTRGEARGYPLDDRLRLNTLAKAARLLFIETASAGGGPALLAVDAGDPSLKIFSDGR